ncbi:hypothetical protein [Lacinutrix cladophorae]
MKKGDKHYVIFKKNNEVEIKEDINGVDKSEVRFIIERTYRKQSSGGYYQYFNNTILNSDLKSTDNKSFNWNGIKCEIIKDEHWTAKREDGSGAIIFFKITDYFNNDKEYKFRTQKKISFEIIKNKLVSIEKFKSHENAAEFEKLNSKVNSLENKIYELEKIVNSIKS